MESYLQDWLNLALKFTHLITGIAWIGASFYFNWLENNLERALPKDKDNLAGNLWAVHGGGFYYLEKYKTYPDKIPEPLHWFKWEAYFTWISGFLLVVSVYYFHADTYLLKTISDINSITAISFSLVGIVISWILYDLLCKSALAKNQYLILIIMFIFGLISAYFYSLYFNEKAVFMQIGVMIGTIMVANVFFVIMPSQRELVQACEDKTKITQELVYRGYMRSRHNNYFTLPILFVMISMHYPMIYTASFSFLILFWVFAIAILIRHYFNLKGANLPSLWVIPTVAILLSALMITLAPKPPKELSIKINYEEAKIILDKRCATCHSSKPSDDTFKIAPLGFLMDTYEQIIKNKELIYKRTILNKDMPFANKTKMSDYERDKIDAYLRSLK